MSSQQDRSERGGQVGAAGSPSVSSLSPAPAGGSSVGSSSGNGDRRLDWKFCQVFGDTTALENIQEPDVISAVTFNHDGSFLAAGDRGGRIVIFSRTDRPPRRSRDGSLHPNVEYRFYNEFQSHDVSFDYLRSNEIAEGINAVSFLEQTRSKLMLLATNDKTVKLWKVQNKSVPAFTGLNRPDSSSSITSPGQLRIPRVCGHENALSAKNIGVYDKAHGFKIHSIAPMADGRSFLSADELQINLWDLDHTDELMQVVDNRPDDFNELQEVITVTRANGRNNGMFAYGTSRGFVNVCDTRALALAKRPTMSLSHDCGITGDSCIRELVSSISDVSFVGDHSIVARSYLHVLAWDDRNPSRPIVTIPVMPYLHPLAQRLCSKDAVFDRFSVGISSFGMDKITSSNGLGIRYIVTGGYNYTFSIFDLSGPGGPNGITARASRHLMRANRNQSTRSSRPPPPNTQSMMAGVRIPRGEPCSMIEAHEVLRDGKLIQVPSATLSDSQSASPQPPPTQGMSQQMRVDLPRKIIHVACHPRDHVLAIATTANLFIYAAMDA